MAGNRSLQSVHRWADIVIERWQKKIAALDVRDTGELLRSLKAQVDVDSNGDPAKVTFLFLYYGRFPDMGVRKGIKLGNPAANGRKKPWYSTEFLRQVNRLGELMAIRAGYEAAEIISAWSGPVDVGKNDEDWHALQKK